ncbi:hypothetical protein [Pseudomarimonas arenosa]|uniref:Uncharacterized protein n=1 Tax=Pseudomarimonas arenosa TaxID=2774145 RepID=A0AAW3ZND7_9GAMM|nr:hypothetical protein [Pseudomarimonas arenosa]MBD8526689.1 hypothetical protein [Pseudomarimonas arenosa]
MKQKLLSIALVAAGALAASSPFWAEPTQAASAYSASTNAPDPARQIQDWARLFRTGNVPALARAVVPESRWDQLVAAYELQKLHPLSERDRAQYAEKISRLTAPDAVEQLMVEIEPKLEEARPQAPGALMMGMGALQLAATSPESELTDEQRQALQNAIPGIQDWANRTDFLDSTTMRQALGLITEAARRARLDNLDEIRGLPLEAALDRASTMLAAAKQATRLYGLDLDQIADSLTVDVLEMHGESARVRTTIVLFDAPVSFEHDLELVEGRWYGKEAARHLREASRFSVEG